MSAEVNKEVQLEIAHVLFIDIVGYSKLLINQQSELLRLLNEVVRTTEQFRVAEQASQLVRLPTGDGMALAFFSSPDAPVRCAMEIDLRLKEHPQLNVRMGIHSGPVDAVKDVNDRLNVAGAGINTAQRVMDCADAGHILLSRRVADDLGQYERWQPHLYDLGECEVKHGVKIEVVNLYTGEVGRQDMPEKLKRPRQEQAALVSRGVVLRRRKMLLALTGMLLLVGISAGFWIRLHPSPSSGGTAAVAIPEKSIAVLPLENLSEEKENAFFADGIQDDILTSLSKIADLKVISRSSVMQHRRGEGAVRNLHEIARTLGVRNVLEGSVRRVGNRVLLNVQLIDALSNRQIWAERYDRTLADSITLQGELAMEIAAALRATLSPEEKAQMAAKPTGNPEAYVLYLRAREYDAGTATHKGLEGLRMAEHLYNQALALDPSFALAHARLARILAYIYHDFQPTEAVKNRARAEADEALRLRPDLGEGHLARALCLYWTEKEYEGALRGLETAARLLPNDGEPEGFAAFIRRRQGRYKEAIAGFDRALARDPRNSLCLGGRFATEYFLRNWPAATRAGEQALALATGSTTLLRIEKGYVDLWAGGDLVQLREMLAEVPVGFDPDGAVTLARWDSALMARDFRAAEQAVIECVSETILTGHGIPVPKRYFLGCIEIARGDPDRARPFLEDARPRMEAEVLALPLEAFRRAELGLLYAFLGRKEDAIREGRAAVELMPVSRDATYGPEMLGLLGVIYAQTGEREQAVDLIERLLTTPAAVLPAFEGSITLAELRLKWQWDPLRNHPRFQKILAGPEPKTVF